MPFCLPETRLKSRWSSFPVPAGPSLRRLRRFLKATCAFAALTAVLPVIEAGFEARAATDLPPVVVPAPEQRKPVTKRSPSRRTSVRTAPRRQTVRRQRAPVSTAPTVVQQVAPPSAAAASLATPPIVARYQLPNQSFSITSRQIDETINLKDPEDAVKYMPSLFVRKRNDGDNQAVLATRTWGLNSSARSMIFLDDQLVSTYLANNNTNGSPHWNLISPESIARVDFISGPFAAAYPGNSIGGVLIYTTKMPDQFVATAKQTVSFQPWSQYGTKDTYVMTQTSMSVGNRNGNFSWLFSANVQDGYAQPLTYTTNATIPAGTTGTFPALNKQGVVANVVGTGALFHTQQTTANLRVAYDLTNWLTATYSLGLWNNVQHSTPQTYLTSTATRLPTFAGISSFAGNRYTWDETQMGNAFSLKSDTRGAFDFDVAVSTYNYLQDTQLSPFTVAATGIGYSTNGRITRNDGTNWQNADAKAIWRPFGFDGPHEVSFGVHGDRYELNNPVYASPIWNLTSSIGTGQIYSEGLGETRTGALWAQDAWKIFPNLKLTLGGRLESWQARDGYNLATTTSSAGVITSTTTKNQPELSSTDFSPKASLSYDLSKEWNVTASFGEAYRYPTVGELYQNITVNGVATFANPFLAPEQDFQGEVFIERKWNDGRVRLTAFAERTNDAIISQTNLATNPLTGAQVPTTTIGNVAAIRMQGIEFSAEKDNVWISGLQLFGSVTYVDSKILSDPTWAGTNPLTGLPDTVVGKRVPYVPDWRAKAGFTYRPDEQWAWTVAARYSGKQYSTLDNTDIIPHVYGAFDLYFVVDTKLHYAASKNFSFDFGIDNLFNEQYFLFHPFSGRTYVLAAKYTY